MPLFRFSNEKDVPYGSIQRAGCWGFLTHFSTTVFNTKIYYKNRGKSCDGVDLLGFPYKSKSLPSFIQIPTYYSTGVERLESIYKELIVKSPQWFDGVEFINNEYLRVPTNIPFGRAYNLLRLLRNAMRQGRTEWINIMSAPLTTAQKLFAIDMYYGGSTDACITPRAAMENMNAIIKRFEDGVDLIEDNSALLISDDLSVQGLFNKYGQYTISQFLEPKMREKDFSISYYGFEGNTRDGSGLPTTLTDFIKEVNV